MTDRPTPLPSPRTEPLLGRSARAVARWLEARSLPVAMGTMIVALLSTNAAVVAQRAAAEPGSQAPTVAAIAEEQPVRATPAPTPVVEPVVEAPAPAPPAPPAVPVAAPPPPAAPAPDVAGDPVALVGVPERLAAFRGLSTWIDLYDVTLSPEQQAQQAAAAGVQTIFVQSARFNSPSDIHDYWRLAALIETAHDLGMRVMVWYIPDHLDLAHDLRRSQAAIAFTTPRGDRPDAFGLDIEAEHQTDLAARNAHLVALSSALRAWVGPDYPMAAIVLPPLQLDLRPSWWPDFPYAALRPYYDVYIPMSYSSFRGTDVPTTYGWNLNNIIELRRRAGDPNLLVHMAGGIADDLPEVGAFVDASRDGQVIGSGLYDLDTTPASAWPHLRRLRAID